MHIWDGKVADKALRALQEYCWNRNTKCNGCRYRINKVVEGDTKYTECIFANCPSSWGDYGRELQ